MALEEIPTSTLITVEISEVTDKLASESFKEESSLVQVEAESTPHMYLLKDDLFTTSEMVLAEILMSSTLFLIIEQRKEAFRKGMVGILTFWEP